MAARIVKTIPGSGTVSRVKYRAAARHLLQAGKAKHKKGVVTKARTASGRKQIAFTKASLKAAAF